MGAVAALLKQTLDEETLLSTVGAALGEARKDRDGSGLFPGGWSAGPLPDIPCEECGDVPARRVGARLLCIGCAPHSFPRRGLA